jgi:hypothetical protein
MKLSYHSDFKPGDEVKFRSKTKSGWNYYGEVLSTTETFGCQPMLTIRLNGMIMPDGDMTVGIDDLDNPTPTVFALEQDVEDLCGIEEVWLRNT